jgi:large repetitive protein
MTRGCHFLRGLLAGLSFAGLVSHAVADAPVTNAVRVRVSDVVTYHHEQDPAGPWSIQIARVRRDRGRAELHTTLGQGRRIALATLSEQMSRFPRGLGRPLAALNGDYFVREGRYAGDPQGLCIVQGELVSAPNEKSCFWVTPEGALQSTNVVSNLAVIWPDGTRDGVGLNEERGTDRPVVYSAAIGPSTGTDGGTEILLDTASAGEITLRPGEDMALRVREIRSAGDTPLASNRLVLSLPPKLASKAAGLGTGTAMTFSTATFPDLRGVRTAISGGPALIRGGRATEIRTANVRHPRSAIGWNEREFVFVQVDGRQPAFSVGMTLLELRDLMMRLGCTEALNLDGGGSSTFWAQGNVMNSPCEGSERPMGNALTVTWQEP